MDKAPRATADRIQHALKERESAKKIADPSQQLAATAAALRQAVVVAAVAGVVVGRKGRPASPSPGDEPFAIATDPFDFGIPAERTLEVLKRLHPGQPVRVIVPDVPNSRYAGSVNGIGKELGGVRLQ